MDCIKVVDLEVFAHHGVLDFEKESGQNFYVSFEAYMDLAPSAAKDDLNLSVSYADMCHSVKAYMTEHTYDLIETVTEGIAHELLLTYALIRGVKVTLKKPLAPIGEPVDYPAIVMERRWHQVYIGIGSNMGDREQIIRKAIEKIASHEWVRMKQVATLIETEAWGNIEQPAFMNGAIHIETLMNPSVLMTYLLDVEAEFDRKREVKWGPRTLDLDVLLYDDLITDDPHITLPHPLMTQRAFVLEPLCELNSNLLHPLYQMRMFELLEKINH